MATVVNKLTLQVVISQNSSDFSEEDWIVFGKGSDTSALEELLATTPDLRIAEWLVENGTLRRTTPEEQQAFWNTQLPDLRSAKIADIEARTEDLLSLGFEYPSGSGNVFALDLHTRTLMLGMLISRDLIPYPIAFNTIDQLTAYQIKDSNDVVGFYMAALGTVKAREDSGTDLKELARVAKDRDELNKLTDTRK